MANTSTKSRRRWFQFSLRTLLALVTLAVGLLVAWRIYVEPYRQQRETMKLIEELGGTYKTASAEKWLRWLYGDDFQYVVLVDLADCDDPGKYLDQVAALPCLETLVVGGRSFGDGHLARMKGLNTLRGLILDSTSVTGGSIASMKRALPNVVVYKSQRRTIAAIQRLGGEVDIELDDVHSQFRRPELKKYFQYLTDVEFSYRPKVGDAELVHLEGLTQLRWLALRFCRRVSDAGLSHLREFDNLEVLILCCTPVSNAGLAHLKGLTNLKGLDLTYTRVSGVGLAHLKGLTKLEWLCLEGTPVSDADLSHLKGLANLRVLDLSYTQVSDAGLHHLNSLTELEYLNLKGTRVTNTGDQELQEALPKCVILMQW